MLSRRSSCIWSRLAVDFHISDLHALCDLNENSCKNVLSLHDNFQYSWNVPLLLPSLLSSSLSPLVTERSDGFWNSGLFQKEFFHTQSAVLIHLPTYSHLRIYWARYLAPAAVSMYSSLMYFWGKLASHLVFLSFPRRGFRIV